MLCIACFAVSCGGQAGPGGALSSDASDVLSDEASHSGSEASNADAEAMTGSNADSSSGPLDATLAADVAACTQITCPTGCCDTSGQCQAGVVANACGTAGEACRDCVATGFPSCDRMRHACFSNLPGCGPANCSGCCAGGACLSGIDATACGAQGAQCADCMSTGATCVANAGTATACGPISPGPCNFYTCRHGCCDANGVCQPGTSSSVCGTGGLACRACHSGQACNTSQYCDCTPQSCPSGCCDVLTAQCQPGRSDALCGSGGSICQTCALTPTKGAIFTPSVCSNQFCASAPPCPCASGCCDANGVCHPGASNTQCGGPQTYCEDCTAVGAQCSQQQCGASLDAGVCNAQTCPTGCCDLSGQCQQGLTSTLCGASGANCTDCHGAGQICSNQECVSLPDGGPICGPMTCDGCCDALGRCSLANTDVECGNGGRACADCTKFGGSCTKMVGFGTCDVPDGAVICAQSCDGCCDTKGTCQAGFANAQCGEAGGACRDCTALSPPSACDANVSPRTCTSQQTTCPALYPSCPAALQEQVPAPQKVCSTSDLQNAAAACAGGPTTTACGTFTAFEFNSNYACSTCLQNFIYDFGSQLGILVCAAPFVDSTCNHNSACLADCLAESCYGCVDPASTTQCNTQVQTGACSAYLQATQCVTQALGGPAAICNPATYQANFGAWLQAVGAKYCGP
jgi:hypothetical protein